MYIQEVQAKGTENIAHKAIMRNFSNPETEMAIQTEKTFKTPKRKEWG